MGIIFGTKLIIKTAYGLIGWFFISRPIDTPGRIDNFVLLLGRICLFFFFQFNQMKNEPIENKDLWLLEV